ncbi:hypothetical protein [Bacillus toyonensis]|uniref:hypothetical protein n=1 Tax=Bacillus toyonensis TaxID=155322 RepID=UPI000BEE24E1|nr:hypothetical protein [Bacillus toyonensis]PEF99670.1 hypothetical protein COO01_04720 [Bacillus toyonensis]
MESPDRIIPQHENCAINFDSLKHKTPYTLIIEGSTSHSGTYFEFQLEYIGIELITKKGYIPENVLLALTNDLNDIFGHGPFNKSKIDSEFKKLNRWMYSITGDSVTRK